MRRVELVAAVVLVLVVELLNTAIEKLADRLTTDHDPQIGRVKDMGSAAVGRRAGAWPACSGCSPSPNAWARSEACNCSLPARKAPSRHDRTAAQFTITLAQLNPTVGDVAGNAAKARAARAQARGRRRRSGGAAGIVHRRLSAGRPGAEAGVSVGLPRRHRGAGARNRRWRPGHADRHALGRGRQALQCLRAARRRAHRRHPLQGQPAELRRVR